MKTLTTIKKLMKDYCLTEKEANKVVFEVCKYYLSLDEVEPNIWELYIKKEKCYHFKTKHTFK